MILGVIDHINKIELLCMSHKPQKPFEKLKFS